MPKDSKYSISGGRSRQTLEKAGKIIVDKEFKPANAEDVFYKFLSDITDQLTNKLTSLNKDQPGELIQSIGENSTVTTVGGKIFLSIGMEDYWAYVDEGVDGTEKSQGSKFKYKKNGKRIPLDAMKKHIAAKGITPAMSISAHRKSETFKDKRIKKQAKKVNKETALESMAYAMGVNLKKYGLKPSHFFTDVVNDKLKERLTKEISAALKKDIEIDFKTAFK